MTLIHFQYIEFIEYGSRCIECGRLLSGWNTQAVKVNAHEYLCKASCITRNAERLDAERLDKLAYSSRQSQLFK
jgi:hypothetical protein